ncbi:DUF305 domain-containing protein [Pseudonocardia acaciae]|uniref:DUF305 domain-containing protein n=1 Tax=Pseudonocardia acaciae TaxID=551276 RepID=UPI0006856FCF|nr:DUF305 domain-containing protein [Pseudonocardia acaciae]
MTGRDRLAPVVLLVAALVLLGTSVAAVGMAGQRGGTTDEFGYLAGMVAHHEEAVGAARRLEGSGRPEMRALGASIVATQTAEIAMMKGWLAAWYPGRSAEVAYRPMMRDLSELTGDALDQAFLRDMIPHHMTAVMMSQRLLTRGAIQHPEVTVFAARVRDAQHAEIFQMRGYLTGGFRGGPHCGAGPAT